MLNPFLRLFAKAKIHVVARPHNCVVANIHNRNTAQPQSLVWLAQYKDYKMNESSLPAELMKNSLLHFQSGVPIDDLALRVEQKQRLARVDHVYWQWLRNPFSVDYKGLLQQIIKNSHAYADVSSETHALTKDVLLFEYIRDAVSPMSRNEAKVKIQVAAEKMLRIGMETDNVNALDKGSKRLYEVAGLDKPEDNKVDINKVSFLPSVVVTNIKEVDETKDNYDDEETKRIAMKYGAYVDDKRKMVEDEVAKMEARGGNLGNETGKEIGDGEGRG